MTCSLYEHYSATLPGRAWLQAGMFLVALCVFGFMAGSGRLLVVDEPRRSDVILVLAGETDRRPARGLELLDQGYGRRLVLDVPAGAKIYQWTQPELAERYIQGLPEARSVAVCPIYGRSTKAEAREAGRCLEVMHAGSVLLVTSEYHSRRGLSTFRREAPNHDYSVAAVYDAREFGVQWWRRREWAKTNFYEWSRLAWWEVMDRWF